MSTQVKVKAILLALGVAAFAAAGAMAEGGPPGGTTGPAGHGAGDRGGSPPGPHQPASPDQGQGVGRAFRQQLTAAGYRCLRRPAILHGSLKTVGADSLTVHATRGRTGVGTDVTVKILAATRFFRMGPAKVTDLVVGDNVVVFAAVCRTASGTTGETGTTGPTSATATGLAPPTLVARRVGAHPAHTAHV